MIDVVELGADPTGHTDSTAAFRIAAQRQRDSTITYGSGGELIGSVDSIVIPAGKYLINDEIKFGPRSQIIAEGHAIVVQTVPGKRIFVFEVDDSISKSGGTDIRVSGIQCRGGTNQIVICNANIDESRFSIQDCGFESSLSTAIVLKGTGNGRMSAMAVIEKCRFRRCWAALETYCDQTTIRDTWITWTDGSPTSAACIVNRRGTLTLDHQCMLVPVFEDSSKVRWIDNYASVTADGTRFSGESAGIPILRHFSVPQTADPFMGDSVIFRGCQLSAGPAAVKTSAIITLDGGLPALIVFDGNKYMSQVAWILDTGKLDSVLKALSKQVAIKIKTGSNQNVPNTVRVPEKLNKFLVA